MLGSVAVAGCIGGATDDSPRVGLGRIELTNGTADPVTLRVVVDREDERVYDERLTLAGHREIVEAWMGDPVHYSVAVRVPDDPRESEVTTARIESMVDEWNDIDCFKLGFSVDDDDVASHFGGDACP